jgi:hypothetical protein
MINNSKRKLPWINKEIKSLIRKRNKLYKKMNKHRNTKTIQQYTDTKQRLQKETDGSSSFSHSGVNTE